MILSDEANFIYNPEVDNGLVYTFSKTVINALKGKYFRFKVAAVNDLGTGEYSEEI